MSKFKRTNIEGLDVGDSLFELTDYVSIIHTYKVFKEDETNQVPPPKIIRRNRWEDIPQEAADEMDVITDMILGEIAPLEEKYESAEDAISAVLSGRESILKDLYYDDNLKQAIANVAVQVYMRNRFKTGCFTHDEAEEKVRKNMASLTDDFEQFMKVFILLLSEQSVQKAKSRGITLEQVRTEMKPKVAEIDGFKGIKWHFEQITYDLSEMKKKSGNSRNDDMFI
tara:strand:+ start:448 stop:1125 length:678 start_codon:yes stop_codon:yes gene_type:complete